MTTRREKQIAEIESELRLVISKARRRDLLSLLAEAKKLLKDGK